MLNPFQVCMSFRKKILTVRPWGIKRKCKRRRQDLRRVVGHGLEVQNLSCLKSYHIRTPIDNFQKPKFWEILKKFRFSFFEFPFCQRIYLSTFDFCLSFFDFFLFRFARGSIEALSIFFQARKRKVSMITITAYMAVIVWMIFVSDTTHEFFHISTSLKALNLRGYLCLWNHNRHIL